VRFAVLTAGSRGDVKPYVALATGLRRAGHEVCLATHEGFRDLAARHGLDIVPVPQPPAGLTRSRSWRRWQRSGPGVARFVRGFALATRAGQPVIDGMLDAFWSACDGADVVHWRLFRAPLDDWLGRRLGARPGRGPDRRGFLGTDPELVLYGISPLVVPRPADWDPAIELCGFWFTDPPPDWSPPPALTSFLEAGPPPVYVHLSRIPVKSRSDLLRTVLGALDRLGLRGLLHTGMDQRLTGAHPVPGGRPTRHNRGRR
jgi:sterol 3beta-glucosyltransferase